LKLLPLRTKSNWEVHLPLPLDFECLNCSFFWHTLFVDYETHSLNPSAVSLHYGHYEEVRWIYEIVFKEIVTEKLDGNEILTIENELIAVYQEDL